MTELHQALHESMGMCIWTLLALVIFAAFTATAALHHVKNGKREKEFAEAFEERFGFVRAERR